MDMPIDEMDISVRTINAVRNAGYTDFIAFCENHSKAEMLRIPNFGLKSFNEVKEIAKIQGINIKDAIKPSKVVCVDYKKLYPLKTLALKSIQQLTGLARLEDLPGSQKCSEPFYWAKGMDIPLPDGVNISVWRMQTREGPFWSPERTNSRLWDFEFLVFRVHHTQLKTVQQVNLPENEIVSPESRIANALERLVFIFEKVYNI